MTWGPWICCDTALPEPGDYVRLKCWCFDYYHETIYFGTTPEGRIRCAPDGNGMGFCYWSKKIHGDLSEVENVREEELT